MIVWAVRCEMGAPEDFWVIDSQVYVDPERAKQAIRDMLKEQDEEFEELEVDGNWLIESGVITYFLEKLHVVE